MVDITTQIGGVIVVDTTDITTHTGHLGPDIGVKVQCC